MAKNHYIIIRVNLLTPTQAPAVAFAGVKVKQIVNSNIYENNVYTNKAAALSYANR